MRRRRKSHRTLLLISLILGIGLGYALLTQNLSIIGTSKVRPNEWDIHFENIVEGSDNVALATEDYAAVIDPTTKTRVNCHVTLNKPGDSYTFSVDAVNAGTIDGMIEVVYKKLNNVSITTLPSYLEFSVTYFDGDEILNHHILEVGDRETYLIKVAYKKDISVSDIPPSDQAITLSFEVNYVQADKQAIHRLANYYISPDYHGPSIDPSLSLYIEGKAKVVYTDVDIYIFVEYIDGIEDNMTYGITSLTECQELEYEREENGVIYSGVCVKAFSAGDAVDYNSFWARSLCLNSNNQTICLEPKNWDCEYNNGTCENSDSYVLQKKLEAEEKGFTCSFLEDEDMELFCDNSSVSFSLYAYYSVGKTDSGDYCNIRSRESYYCSVAGGGMT